MQNKTKYYIFAAINSVLGSVSLLGAIANFYGIYAVITALVAFTILLSGLYLFKANEYSRLTAALVSSLMIPVSLALIIISVFYLQKNSGQQSVSVAAPGSHHIDGLGAAIKNMEFIAGFILLFTGIILLGYFALQFFVMMNLKKNR